MKVHDWNLPYGEGGWNVNWSQELKAKKERGVVLNVSCSCFLFYVNLWFSNSSCLSWSISLSLSLSPSKIGDVHFLTLTLTLTLTPTITLNLNPNRKRSNKSREACPPELGSRREGLTQSHLAGPCVQKCAFRVLSFSSLRWVKEQGCYGFRSKSAV